VFGVLLPGAYLFAIPFGWGLIGIWSAAALYMAVGATVMSIQFLRGGWKSVKI
jgi:Na+-driven multidrug efflux pump